MHTTDDIAVVLRKNIIPKYIYMIYDCRINAQSVMLGEMTISSVSLAKHLECCRRAVLLAATLGVNADILIRKYSVQDMEKAVLAQQICTAMIETYLDEVENDLSRLQELKNLFPVRRFSPGYGDFDVTCQKEILNLLGASRIGISLTEGFMMIPSKSVTAVIGFSEEQKEAYGKCSCCDDKNCCFREEI